jgi:hypothetical protein
MLDLVARSWWILSLRGIVALFYALVAVVWSGATPIVLMLLLGMYAFVDGLLGVISAFENYQAHGQRALLLPMGLAEFHSQSALEGILELEERHDSAARRGGAYRGQDFRRGLQHHRR